MGHAFVRGDDRLMQASLDLARAMKRRRVDPGLKEYVDKVRKLVGESVRDGMHSSLKNVR